MCDERRQRIAAHCEVCQLRGAPSRRERQGRGSNMGKISQRTNIGQTTYGRDAAAARTLTAWSFPRCVPIGGSGTMRPTNHSCFGPSVLCARVLIDSIRGYAVGRKAPPRQGAATTTPIGPPYHPCAPQAGNLHDIHRGCCEEAATGPRAAYL